MASRKRTPAERASPWIGPVLLASVLAGVALVMRLPTAVFGGVLAVLFAVPLVWILASALWPASAERTCPRCGEARLRRMDAEATHGLDCAACGFRDETRSAWLLAEEEGPLEHIVLRERRRRRQRRPRGHRPDGPSVDSRRSED